MSALSPAEGLARAAADADVVVVGSHDIETTRGISLGRVAKPLLTMARSSVLIARQPPDLPLFEVIDLAAGGSPLATTIAAHLAAEHGSELRTIAPGIVAAATAAIGCGLVVTGRRRGRADRPRGAVLRADRPRSPIDHGPASDVGQRGEADPAAANARTEPIRTVVRIGGRRGSSDANVCS